MPPPATRCLLRSSCSAVVWAWRVRDSCSAKVLSSFFAFSKSFFKRNSDCRSCTTSSASSSLSLASARDCTCTLGRLGLGRPDNEGGAPPTLSARHASGLYCMP
ncbi:hypothetical protein V8C86DRAFT_2577324 [Haematococcus lacustris]